MLGASLSDVSRWTRTNGLQIVIVVTGAILAARAISCFGARAGTRIDATARADDPVVTSEDSKHRRALAQAITWTLVAIVYFVAGILVIERLNVPLATLVAPATVAGVALGFGA